MRSNSKWPGTHSSRLRGTVQLNKDKETKSTKSPSTKPTLPPMTHNRPKEWDKSKSANALSTDYHSKIF